MVGIPHPGPARGGVGAGARASTSRPAIGARPLPADWGVVRRRISRLMVVALALLMLASVGLFQVLQTTRVTAVGYEVGTLEHEHQALEADIRLLEAQIASSSNLEHLEQDATTRLGMVPAPSRVTVSVDVPAPAVVPLPRRYVVSPTHEALPGTSWWEDLLGKVPGLH